MISSHVKISMISPILSLSFTLYLNSLVHHRNIFRSSSKVFGNLRKSSETFGNSRKMFGSVRLAFGTILENLQKPSESGRKSSENHQKLCHQYVYIIKRTLLRISSKIWILCSRGKNNIFTRSLELTREILFLPLEHKIHIFSPPCNILYMCSGSENYNRNRKLSVESVCIICRMDVVAQVDKSFDSSTILRPLSFMLTGCDGCIESDRKSLSRSVEERSL